MIVQCKSIALGYGNAPLIENLSFALKAGEVCGVVGHNGAGKSTFVKTMLGLQSPIKGQFDWENGDPPTLSYLGQRDEFDNQFPIRVYDLVAMGAWHGLGFWSGINEQKAKAIETALHQTNLMHMADRPLYECSAGQLQRCFFARAIVQDAPLILLDEPFTAIDQSTEANLVEIIKSWRDEGRGLVVVLHDLPAIKALCDKVLLIGNGASEFGCPEDVLTTDNLLKHHYLSPTQASWLREGGIS